MKKTILTTMITSSMLYMLVVSPCYAISIRNNGTIVGDAATITQDRFEANTPGPVVNPDFKLSAHDFSGVGWDSLDVRKSIALISSQHFVASDHFTPSGAVNFLTSSGVTGYSVASYTTIANPTGGGLSGNSDIQIGTLTAPIDLGATGLIAYDFLDPSISVIGKDILIYGQKGRVGSGHITEVNNLTVDYDPDPVGEDLHYGYTTKSVYTIASGGDDDSYFTGGDSGGPSFIVKSDDSIALTGVHWVVGSNAEVGVAATERHSYDSYLPFYKDEIESQITGLTIGTTVPEPSTCLFSGLAAVGFILRRKRYREYAETQ